MANAARTPDVGVDEDAILDSLTQEELQKAHDNYEEHKQRIEYAPQAKNLLGPFTIFCMVMNRTIGSGIFTVPPSVLVGTGSVGGSLLVWTFGGVIAFCGALCWLEMGLSIPFHSIKDHNGIIREVSAPRSGGEKNIIEYIFRKPKFLATCVYGILFIVLGNISGNAIAFGIYVAIAAGKDPVGADQSHERGLVIGLAVMTLTICAAVHIFTRRGGVILNNIAATLKVAMLLAISLIGFIHAGGKYLRAHGVDEGGITTSDVNNAVSTNFDPDTSFRAHTPGPGLASYVDSFTFALFSYTGFYQPFYVLSEFSRPRKTFPPSILGSMVLVTVLYMMVNVSYFCVVPKQVYLDDPSNTLNMAGSFMHYLFDESLGPNTAERVMAGLVAFSCFGNVIIMTFTAARVKQELAKEGILPWSLFFASGRTTPWAWLRSRFPSESRRMSVASIDDSGRDNRLEKAPIAALTLHWATSIFLVVVTLPLKLSAQYSFLTGLYSYVNFTLFGFFVSGGLLYLKLDSFYRGERGRHWSKRAGYIPWLSPLHVIVYFIASTFFLFASFVKPRDGTPFTSESLGYVWFIMPTIGLTGLLWGLVWWAGLKGIEWSRRKVLVVTRTPYIERDEDGNYVQKAELVEHDWMPVVGSDVDSEKSR